MSASCRNCGYDSNPPDAGACLMCSAALAEPSAPALPETPTTVKGRDRVAGRITWIKERNEPADFNPYRFFSQLLLTIVFFPLLVGVMIVSTALWLAFAIAGLRSLSQGFSPTNLVSTINSFGILFGIVLPRRMRSDDVPVFDMSIRSSGGGEERHVVLKGRLAEGTCRQGDRVRFEGTWRGETLRARTGRNESLQTDVVLAGNPWKVVLLLIVALLAAAGITAWRNLA